MQEHNDNTENNDNAPAVRQISGIPIFDITGGNYPFSPISPSTLSTLAPTASEVSSISAPNWNENQNHQPHQNQFVYIGNIHQTEQLQDLSQQDLDSFLNMNVLEIANTSRNAQNQPNQIQPYHMNTYEMSYNTANVQGSTLTQPEANLNVYQGTQEVPNSSQEQQNAPQEIAENPLPLQQAVAGCSGSTGTRTTRKRARTAFTAHQLLNLEKQFKEHQYITRSTRIYISQVLDLSERQVKIWFQNRRMKFKKQQNQLASSASSAGSTSPEQQNVAPGNVPVSPSVTTRAVNDQRSIVDSLLSHSPASNVPQHHLNAPAFTYPAYASGSTQANLPNPSAFNYAAYASNSTAYASTSASAHVDSVYPSTSTSTGADYGAYIPNSTITNADYNSAYSTSTSSHANYGAFAYAPNSTITNADYNGAYSTSTSSHGNYGVFTSTSADYPSTSADYGNQYYNQQQQHSANAGIENSHQNAHPPGYLIYTNNFRNSSFGHVEQRLNGRVIKTETVSPASSENSEFNYSNGSNAGDNLNPSIIITYLNGQNPTNNAPGPSFTEL